MASIPRRAERAPSVGWLAVHVTDLAALAATLLAVGGLWPQILRLVRTGDVAGVSITWATLGVATNGAWFAYALHEELWFAAPCTVAMMCFYSALGVALARHGVAPGRPVVVAGAWAILMAVIGAVGGWAALGIVLGVAYAVQVAPSVWSAYRTWAPSGISPATWAISVVEIALWGTYGVAKRDPAVMTFAFTGVLAGGAILGRWYATRHRFGERALVTGSG